MKWNITADRPVYLQLIEQLELAIVAGEYRAGARLPGVREMAAGAAVNPNTMQRALQELEARGLLNTQRTAGRTVTEDKTMIAQLREQLAAEQIGAFLQMMDGALTGKTGFTGKAGYCYVGALERDGRLYIVSLLACGWPGNKSYKWADTKKLMNYGLSAYETKKLETPAVPKMRASVIDGVYDWTKQTKSQVKLICPDAPDKYQVLAKDGEKIEIQIRARKELASPVLEDEVCGEVSFWLSEVCLGTYPITARIYPEQAVDKRAFVWYIMRVLSLLL